jgi:hypothetical protein
MKKIYMKPALQMEQMDDQNIICASDPKVSIDTEGSVDAGSVESRRKFNTWDDEDEE